MSASPTLRLSATDAAAAADALPFSAEQPLLPATAIDDGSGEVLMQAWMNRDAFLETLTSGQVCYYSRSRQALWRKGETSGHTQRLIAVRTDCDRDSILLFIEQTGAACHTNRRSCFFHALSAQGEWRVIAEPMASPTEEER